MIKEKGRLFGKPFRPQKVEVLTPEATKYRAEQGMDARAEYKKLRKRAEERLRAFKRAGETSIEIYRDYVNRFPRLSEIGESKKELYYALSEVTRFLNYKQSTVGGYRAAVEKAYSTFEQHYINPPDIGSLSPEDKAGLLPSMDWRLFGELMRAIKIRGNSAAYYRGWQKAYREVLSKASRAGLSQQDLLQAVKQGDIRIGAKGGLYDVGKQRYIAGQWSKMGK